MDPITILTALANWTPVVSLIHSAAAAGGGNTPSLGGMAYDLIAFLKGMEALGRVGAWLATKTETEADDRFWRTLGRWTGQALHLTARFTTPGVTAKAGR